MNSNNKPKTHTPRTIRRIARMCGWRGHVPCFTRASKFTAGLTVRHRLTATHCWFCAIIGIASIARPTTFPDPSVRYMGCAASRDRGDLVQEKDGSLVIVGSTFPLYCFPAREPIVAAGRQLCKSRGSVQTFGRAYDLSKRRVLRLTGARCSEARRDGQERAHPGVG